MAYRIFTDATADLNDELLMGLPKVEVIPMEIMIDGKPYTYGLNEELTPKQFYTELRKGKFASTSQINPAVYEEYFEKALKKGEDIIYFCFSSGLSGTINMAKWAIRELEKEYPERKIICIDTLGAALGEGFFVCEAARKKMEGLSIEELAQWAEDNKLKVCHWFTVDSFTHLKHGGRVSAATAMIGTTLNIKPLLHVTEEGTLQAKEKPRGTKQAMKMLMKKMEEGWKPELGKKIFIGHGDAIEKAFTLKRQICEKFPDAEVQIADIGAVIGSHTGPDILVLIYWGNNR